jgi:hypothetical protein
MTGPTPPDAGPIAVTTPDGWYAAGHCPDEMDPGASEHHAMSAPLDDAAYYGAHTLGLSLFALALAAGPADRWLRAQRLALPDWGIGLLWLSVSLALATFVGYAVWSRGVRRRRRSGAEPKTRAIRPTRFCARCGAELAARARDSTKTGPTLRSHDADPP